MITKDILDEVFNRFFAPGNYLPQLEKMEAIGGIDRKRMTLMIVKGLESQDVLDKKITELEKRLKADEKRLPKIVKPVKKAKHVK
jgi:hypothetical protein